MRFHNVMVIVLTVFLIGGCAKPRDLIVLIPDADGRVGQISVTNATGTQTLDQAYMVVEVSSGDRPQMVPDPMDKAEVEKIFGPVIKARPDVPARFILYFFTGSTELKEKSRAQIPEILATISQRQSYDVFTIGHTDTLGAAELNIRLSLRRAQAVRDVLASNGVDLSRIQVTYHGEGDPLVPTGDNVNEPLNRRVEVVIR